MQAAAIYYAMGDARKTLNTGHWGTADTFTFVKSLEAEHWHDWAAYLEGFFLNIFLKLS